MAYKEKDTKKWTAQWFETNARGEKKKRRKRGFETKREALEYERQKKLNNSRSMDMKLSEFMEIYFDDKQNEYVIGYTQKIKYDSKLYNTFDSGIDAISILMNSVTFKPVGKYEYAKDAVSLIGFADVTINGVTYTIAVIKTPTQAVKA